MVSEKLILVLLLFLTLGLFPSPKVKPLDISFIKLKPIHEVVIAPPVPKFPKPVYIAYVPPVLPVYIPSVPPVLPTPNQDAKSFIYEHESGNNPGRWNTSGCVGLGQACPASKLLSACPTLDYGCEDAWFTQYAQDRYGGWDNAYYFWRGHFYW